MKALVLLCLFVVANAKHEQYQGWKSYYIKPSTPEQVKALGYIIDAYDVDILSHPIVEREGVVVVKPQYEDGLIKMLEQHDIEYRIHAADIKAAFDYDDYLIEERKNSSWSRITRDLPYDNYQELEVVHYRKPVIVIDGGIHSREWISPPTVTWAIRKLVEDVTEPDLLERFDWIILPIVNPDGYKFSFTSNRLWRKTLSTNTHSLSNLCPGVDANRNFDFAWNTVGTSNTPCSDIYAGNQAFSEVETRVVRDILLENAPRIALYLTMHSYGSMILYPWGNDGTLSPNAFRLHLVGIAMADAIQSNSISYFPNYVVGNSLLVLNYAIGGCAEDYAHSIGVPLSYTYELPGLGDGVDGFHLNPRYIQQVCIETWGGIVAGARMAGNMFVHKK